MTKGLGGRAGGEKYLVHDILFKFSLDRFGLFGGSDLAASKGLVLCCWGGGYGCGCSCGWWL